MIINVSSQSELYDALANATGGETIRLAPGNYGDLMINKKAGFDTPFASEVQIVSADPENPAVFSGLSMRDAANLTFDSVTFDYTFEVGDNLWDRPFDVNQSENITIRNSTFDGDLAHGTSDTADGYGFAIGLSFRDSTGITVEQNEFFDFYRGMTVSSSSDVNVLSNDVHSLRMDGFNFSEVSGVLIENNHLHDFNASLNSLDHSDMIQFWTNGTENPSTDIVIRGNHLDIGDGDATQSIFMRNDMVDRSLAGDEMYYRNVLIENNVIVNGHRHGITVGETDGLVIRHNTVLHDDGRIQDGSDPHVEIPRISVTPDSRNVTITDNITSEVDGYGAQAGWSVDNNAIVQDQDPDGPGYYGDVFVTTSLTTMGGSHNFLALPGGLIDQMGAGAPSTLTLSPSPDLTPRFHVTRSEDNTALYHFDASMSTVDHAALPQGATFRWEFPDGTVREGVQITHGFAQGGEYDVSLSVALPDGRITTLDLTLDVAGSDVLSYDADQNITMIDGELATFDDPDRSMSTAGIVMASQGVALSIAREDAADILGEDEFSIALNLTAQSAASAGEIMRMHESFNASVTENGEILFEAMTAAGERIRLTTDGADITDMNAHEVVIHLQNGTLAIDVDGVERASTTMTSPLADQGSHDLVFGNPWGRDNFEGVVSGLSITVNASDFAEAEALAPLPEEITPPPVSEAPAPESEGPVSPELIEPPVSADSVGGLELGETGTALRIARDQIDDILGQDAFGMTLTLSANGADSAGEVMRLHQSLITTINAAGEMTMHAFTEDGTHIRLTTRDAGLNDGAPHEVSISLNAGRLEITVDGQLRAETDMTSPLADQGAHDLAFGNPWGRDNYDGVISTFDITTYDEGGDAVVTPLSDLLMGDAASDDTLNPQQDSTLLPASESTYLDQPELMPGTTASGAYGHSTAQRSDPAEEWISHLESQLLSNSENNFG